MRVCHFGVWEVAAESRGRDAWLGTWLGRRGLHGGSTTGQRRREQIASVGREAASLTLRQAEADVGRCDPAASAAGRRPEGGGSDAALAVVGRAPGLRALAYLGVQPAWAMDAAG